MDKQNSDDFKKLELVWKKLGRNCETNNQTDNKVKF